jgi:hypothetical protein
MKEVPMAHPHGVSRTDEDDLDEALEESFPASDPLSTWSGPDRLSARAGGQGDRAEPGSGDRH